MNNVIFWITHSRTVMPATNANAIPSLIIRNDYQALRTMILSVRTPGTAIITVRTPGTAILCVRMPGTTILIARMPGTMILS